MHALALVPLHRLSGVVPVALRVVTGLVLAAHGWQKLTEMGPAEFGNGMLAGLGVPAPVLFGYLVTYLELIGGVLLIAGLLTRVLALLFTVQLVLATLLVKVDLGLIAPSGAPLPGAELDLVLIAACVALVILGPGRPSVDHAIGIETTEVESVPATGRARTPAAR